MNDPLSVEPAGESSGHCDCCGNETRTIWGYLRSGKQAIACYYLQWTRLAPGHFPNLDFLIGTWGDEIVHDRKLRAILADRLDHFAQARALAEALLDAKG